MKMTPLNKHEHGNLKLAPAGDIGYARTTHFAQLVLPEFAPAAAVFPIVFVLNPKTEAYEPVVMLGFEKGQNLAINDLGQWGAPFVPATIRQYPFGYSVIEGDLEKWVLVFDEECEMLNEQDGDPLFDENGDETEILNTIMQFIGELQGAAAATMEFTRFMQEKGLFTQLNLRIPRGENTLAIDDVFGIDEKKLNELSDEEFLEIKKRGYLPLIYSQLLSLAQMDRLVMLDNEAMASSGMRKPAEGMGQMN